METPPALKKLLFTLYVLVTGLSLSEFPVMASMDKLWDYWLLNESPPDKPCSPVAHKENYLFPVTICFGGDIGFCARHHELVS